ncbi:protein root initiation defective 3 [Tanacetum coccineum]
MESTKDRQVGVDNLQKYEVGLLKVKDALLLGLHECFNCSDRCSFSQGYVYKANTNGEFILTTKLVFDPGGKRVCDLGGSRGSTEYEFGGVGEQVPADISKQGMGGNELVSNDTFVGIADKLTDKWFKISTFMETQVGYLSIRLWCVIEDIDSMGGRIGSHVIVKCDVVAILAGEMNQRDMTSVANIFEVTKFGMTKRSVSQIFLQSVAGYSVTKFCIKNVGLSLFDEVHMLSLNLNLKSSRNLKFSLEPELMVMVIGYILGVVVDDSCDNFALVATTKLIDTVKASVTMIHGDNFSRLKFDIWKWPNKKKKYTHQLVHLVQCLDQNKYKLYISRLSDIIVLKFDESDDERVTGNGLKTKVAETSLDIDYLENFLVATSRLLKEWHGHYRAVTCLVLSMDLSRLISGTRDGSIRVWSLLMLFDEERHQRAGHFYEYCADRNMNLILPEVCWKCEIHKRNYHFEVWTYAKILLRTDYGLSFKRGVWLKILDCHGLSWVIDSLVGSGIRGRNTRRKVPQFSLILDDKHHFKRDGFVRMHPDSSHVRGTYGRVWPVMAVSGRVWPSLAGYGRVLAGIVGSARYASTLLIILSAKRVEGSFKVPRPYASSDGIIHS